MKKSAVVTLVLSGALVAGCDQASNGNDSGWNGGSITNNTYEAGRGYWHAPFGSWYPYPYNYYRPGFGYYAGGAYFPAPQSSPIRASSPEFAGRGEFGGHISRGGFGSFGHASA
jgi:hypothetical protein